MASLFVVFEGGDSAGKSTQAALLAETLRKAGVEHIVTRQPGGTASGERIRDLLLDPKAVLDDRCEALLYAADKAQHVSEVIRPALASGKVVICDRYCDSLIAYQGGGRGLDAGELNQLLLWATGSLFADLTILLDVAPNQAVNNICEKDRVEAAGEAFHARVRQGFLDLAAKNPKRYLVLNARQSVADIATQVRQAVGERLGRSL